MRLLVLLALLLSGCVRSDEADWLLNAKIPTSCKGLVTTFDPYTAPMKFPVELHAEVSNVNRDLLERALFAWEDVVGYGLFVFSDRTSGCDLAIVTDSDKLPNPDIGLTNFGSCGNNRVAFLHWLNPGEYDPEGFTTDVTLAIISHEIGHLLGLDHEPDDPTSLMYPKIGGRQEFSARSICAARYSYARFQ